MATKDPNVSYSSSNPQQHVLMPMGNMRERLYIRDEAKKVAKNIAHHRTEVYNFAMNIYTKWQFGNIAETIFEKKRKKSEPVLRKIFPDIKQRMNSIENNLQSSNQEDWKNAVVSCRTLLMDIADILNPSKTKDEKDKYINRLKDFVSPRTTSKVKEKLLKSFLDEVKQRIEFTLDLTQGGAHKDRPVLKEAENTILYTYLIVADLMEIYSESILNKKIENNN